MIIGLSGYARSGKDTAAGVLTYEFNFERVAFADLLREFLYRLNPCIGRPGEKSDVQTVIDRWTWDGYKETPYSDDIRELLQRLGTECGRQLLGENVWVDAALAVEADNIVVTDCRFPNEASAIINRGGQIWRVHRDGVGPANEHASENSLDRWPFDRWLYNNGTLAQFKQHVHNVFVKERKAYESRF